MMYFLPIEIVPNLKNLFSNQPLKLLATWESLLFFYGFCWALARGIVWVNLVLLYVQEVVSNVDLINKSNRMKNIKVKRKQNGKMIVLPKGQVEANQAMLIVPLFKLN